MGFSVAQAPRKARVAVVGTSQIRRLLEALDSATDTCRPKRQFWCFPGGYNIMFVRSMGTEQRWCSSY